MIFINVTFSLLADSGCPQHVCLGVTELTPGHTGDHIANDLAQVIKSWNIEIKSICSITTDGGANIVAAVRKLMGGERSHVPCVAHLLNLCVCCALSLSDKATGVIEKVWFYLHVVIYLHIFSIFQKTCEIFLVLVLR